MCIINVASYNAYISLAKIAQDEWGKLKQNFRKCLKRRERATQSGSGARYLPTCQFFNEFSFITDTVTNRPTVSNISLPEVLSPPSPFSSPSPSSSTATLPAAIQGAEISLNNSASSENLSVISSITQSNNHTSKKRKVNISNELDNLLLTSIKKDLSEHSKPAVTEEKDQDTLFCLSLVSDFKDLSSRKKRIARLKILQLFYDLHEDDI